MQSVVTIIEAAKDISLITLRDAKLGMNLFSTSSQSTDDQLEMMIRWSSDTIATMCNRVFAKEKVSEQLVEFNTECPRLPLSHFPIRTGNGISPVVTENGVLLNEGDDYIVDPSGGVLTKTGGGTWLVPTIVEYTGGYDLPFESPPALQQAAILLTREGYNAAIRGDQSVRMISHKSARVIYFDPNAAAAKASAGASGSQGTAAMRSAQALLQKFTRYWL